MSMAEWFNGRLPEWFNGNPEVTVDRDEIIVVGRLKVPDPDDGSAGNDAAAEGRVARFREETRRARMTIADEAEAKFGRKVAWGAEYGEVRVIFTSLAIPVMTRLRQRERMVLDTLVAAGVARSRADALAWCVRLVGTNEEKWIASLREALGAVDEARKTGPSSAA